MSSEAVAHPGISYSCQCSDKALARTSLITGISLIILGVCLAAGCFTPGCAYHVAAYFGAGLIVFSLVPFAISMCLFDRQFN